MIRECIRHLELDLDFKQFCKLYFIDGFSWQLGSQGERIMRKLFLFLSLTLLVLASAFVVLPAPAMAAPPECHIVNQTTDIKYDNLQTAVDAATANDTLKLKGTCVGDTNIFKNLTIQGQSNPAFGPATIQGASGVRVVLFLGGGATVNLNGLTITGRENATGGGIAAFGANLTLNDSLITGNHAAASGGAILHFNGTLTLNNTTVTGNSSNGDAGGILAACGSIPTLNNSTVSGNVSTGKGGGLLVACGATLTLNGSTVSNNSANVGGGVYIAGGSVILDATSSISGNMPDDCAGVNCP